MSLDVCLTVPGETQTYEARIFVRQDGQTIEMSRNEWDRKHPGVEPITVQSQDSDEVYSANITHNLGKMADAAGIYDCLWRPDENGITKARQLIDPLTEGLWKLRQNREYYETFNAVNGWGLWENFVPFVAKYLAACEKWPDADVSVSR